MEHFKMYTKKDGMMFLLRAKFGSDGYVVYSESLRMLADGNHFYRPLTGTPDFFAHEFVSVTPEKVLEIFRWLATQKGAEGDPKFILTEKPGSDDVSILIPNLEKLNYEYARKNTDKIMRQKEAFAETAPENDKEQPAADWTPEGDKELWNNSAWRTKIRDLSDTRRDKLRCRHKDQKFKMTELMVEADKGGDFLKKNKWFSFDWLIKNDTNWRKLLDGNYADKKQGPEKTAPKFIGKVVE